MKKLKFRECERERGAHGGEYVDLVATNEEHTHVVAGKHLIFKQSLAACATRSHRVGYKLAIGASRGDSYGLKTGFGPTGMCVIAGGALGTGARGKGGVFLIGTCHDLSVVEKYGRSDMKPTVRRVGATSGLAGLVDKAAISDIKLVKTGFDHRHTYVKLLHNN